MTDFTGPNLLPLQPDESILRGAWRMERGQAIADKVSERIEWLVREQLQYLSSDSSGWNALYRDHRDGRLWERTYPTAEMQGGGPPQLANISVPEAAAKYPSLHAASPPPG